MSNTYERIILNNKKYKFSDNHCNRCLDRNSIYHMITCCEIFSEERKNLVCNKQKEEDNIMYLLMSSLNNPIVENIKKLCNFFLYILTLI